MAGGDPGQLRIRSGRALAEAETLVTEILRSRGYPAESYQQAVADISVDDPDAAFEYRAAFSLVTRESHPGGPSEQQLRTALMHYRELVERLLAADAATAGGGEREPSGSAADGAWAAQPPPASPKVTDSDQSHPQVAAGRLARGQAWLVVSLRWLIVPGVGRAGRMDRMGRPRPQPECREPDQTGAPRRPRAPGGRSARRTCSRCRCPPTQPSCNVTRPGCPPAVRPARSPWRRRPIAAAAPHPMGCWRCRSPTLSAWRPGRARPDRPSSPISTTRRPRARPGRARGRPLRGDAATPVGPRPGRHRDPAGGVARGHPDRTPAGAGRAGDGVRDRADGGPGVPLAGRRTADAGDCVGIANLFAEQVLVWAQSHAGISVPQVLRPMPGGAGPGGGTRTTASSTCPVSGTAAGGGQPRVPAARARAPRPPRSCWSAASSWRLGWQLWRLPGCPSSAVSGRDWR